MVGSNASNAVERLSSFYAHLLRPRENYTQLRKYEAFKRPAKPAPSDHGKEKDRRIRSPPECGGRSSSTSTTTSSRHLKADHGQEKYARIRLPPACAETLSKLSKALGHPHAGLTVEWLLIKAQSSVEALIGPIVRPPPPPLPIASPSHPDPRPISPPPTPIPPLATIIPGSYKELQSAPIGAGLNPPPPPPPPPAPPVAVDPSYLRPILSSPMPVPPLATIFPADCYNELQSAPIGAGVNAPPQPVVSLSHSYPILPPPPPVHPLATKFPGCYNELLSDPPPTGGGENENGNGISSFSGPEPMGLSGETGRNAEFTDVEISADAVFEFLFGPTDTGEINMLMREI